MMNEEMHERLTQGPICSEEPRDDAQLSNYKMNSLWVLIVLEVMLILLAGYALWAKAGGLAPFSRTGSATHLNDNNQYHAP